MKVPSRALIVGLGSIGRRHLANLRALLPDAEIAIWRHARVETREELFGAQLVYDEAAALAFAPDFAVAANPAPMHIAVATRLAENGVHLFLEKPVSDRTEGVAELIAQCRKHGLIFAVGYVLRFNASLQAARRVVRQGAIGKLLGIRAECGAYLPEWRPGTDYRSAVSARQEMGGGVVLELSHELDYVRWIGGEVATVSAQLARLGGFEIDVEDTAEITLSLCSGVLAQIHLDFTQRSPVRTCRFIGSEGTCLWDGIAQRVTLFDSAKKEWACVHEDAKIDRNTMYLAQMENFLAAVACGSEPPVTGEDGLRALEIALAVKLSDKEQRVVRCASSAN